MITVENNRELKSLTTFEIGGPARFFCTVHSQDDIQEGVLWAQDKDIPFFILAGGSNVLIDDEGFDGLVIHVATKQYSFDTTTLTADAGCVLNDLIGTAAKHILGGWEKLAGIPGSLGGALRGNAGAFGVEIKDVVVDVTAFHIHTFEKRIFSNAECQFAYRTSFFKHNPEWVIVSAHIKLVENNQKEILSMIEETIAERERRHLQDVRAAGSYFMNPVAPSTIVQYFETEKQQSAREGRVPAGWLIDKVGMKGEREGGAIASLQHPNYLVNDSGNATAADVVTLADRIKHAVYKEFGITLEEEVTLV